LELDKAMPALKKANEAVDSLEGKYIAEMKSMTVPLPAISNVMQAVMILLGENGDWLNIKKVISKPQFKKDLFEFDKENVSEAKQKKLQKFTKMDDFNERDMLRKSVAAAALCVWVKAIEEYAQALKVVNPKKAKMEAAMAKVAAMVEALQELEDRYSAMMQRLAE